MEDSGSEGSRDLGLAAGLEGSGQLGPPEQAELPDQMAPEWTGDDTGFLRAGWDQSYVRGGLAAPSQALVEPPASPECELVGARAI